MNRPDSGIRWKRIAWITALLTLCSAFAIYVVLSLTQARLMPSTRTERPISAQQALRDAQNELDGSIGWLNHDGYPVTSLRAQCVAGSTDTMQFFISPSMSLLSHIVVYIRLRGNYLTVVQHYFDASRSEYSAKDSVVDRDDMQLIWSAADRIIATASTGSSYDWTATDAAEITLETCRKGHYRFFARYMGTRDPSNHAIFQLDDQLERLSARK